jgi:glycerol-3-phosphate responsive antiterminator
VIAGGLIRNSDEVKRILQKNVVAISTSDKKLWQVNFNSQQLCQAK